MSSSIHMPVWLLISVVLLAVYALRKRGGTSMVPLLLIPFVSGCVGTDQLTSTPELFVDSSFTADEMEGILRGTSRWEEQTDVRLRPTFVDHSAAAVLAQRATSWDGPPNVVVFVRVVGDSDPACPMQMPPNAAADTAKSGWNGSAYTCFRSDSLDSNEADPDPWRFVTMHETGHVFGLVHHAMGNVMQYETTPDEPQTLQCDDLRQYHSIRGWPLPKECETPADVPLPPG